MMSGNSSICCSRAQFQNSGRGKERRRGAWRCCERLGALDALDAFLKRVSSGPSISFECRYRSPTSDSEQSQKHEGACEQIRAKVEVIKGFNGDGKGRGVWPQSEDHNKF